MLDGDFAGREAALKTGQVLLQQGLNVYIIYSYQMIWIR